MLLCPVCKQRFPAGSRFCPFDGQRLAEIMVETGGAPLPEKDELLGALLTERYRLEERLGEGGMGVVYGARHIIIDKRVAVKVLRRQYSKDPRQAERFLREAKAASRIGHPNIVDITDFGKLPDGQVFFVMEFLVGHTLAWEVRRLGAMPAARCLALGAQICRALDAAHAKGIVHRDLKPENIFIVNPSTMDTAERQAGHPLDVIKLLDFGIAKFAWEADGKRLTRAGSVFGTPQYMSPEQAAGQDADQRVDIYALGCILYEMLTGELPFFAETFMGTLTKQMYDQPTPPRELKPELGIPAAVEAVILRAMEKQPDRRFQSAAEFGAALGACVAPLPPASDTEPEPLPPAAMTPTVGDTGPVQALAPPELSTPPARLPERRPPGLLFWAPLLAFIIGSAGVAVWWLAGHRSALELRAAAGDARSRPRPPDAAAPTPDVARPLDLARDLRRARVLRDARRPRAATGKPHPWLRVDGTGLMNPPVP